MILGKKVGMTQIFADNGDSIPVTVIDVSAVKVSKHFKAQDKVSHVEIGKDQVKAANKADTNNYKTLGFTPKFKQMIKLSENETPLEIGTEVSANLFALGDKVDVTGTNKGRGFQGGMVRWGFHGGSATHGQSDKPRSPGSISSGTTLGRIFKGQKMGGHVGTKRFTVQNLKVVDVDMDNNVIAVEGAVPGNIGGYVIIKESVKSKK